MSSYFAEKAIAVASALRSGDGVTLERVRGYSILFLAISAAATLALWMSGAWTNGSWLNGAGLLDAWGRPIGTDFANPYTAGLMALQGRAAEVYDYAAHYAEQVSFFRGGPGHPFYSWPYPPIFLLTAAPLALLPYVPALLVWLALTFALYLAAIWVILPRRLALLAATAFPAVFITVGHGHNAFLTAGLLGLGLALLEKRPWLAGVLLGCLAYKPHLGLVLPLVLLAGGHWRAIGGAAGAVVVLCAVSVAAFGLEPWYAFLASGDVTRTVLLEAGSAGWFKIQSVFAAVRGWGGSVALAYIVQGVVSLAVLAGLVAAWLAGSGRRAKAAACIGTLLVTPYVMDYDMAALAPALAFLAAEGLRHGFRPHEKSLMAAAWAVPLFARVGAQHLHLPLAQIVMALLFVATLKAPLQRAGREDRAAEADAPSPARPSATI